MMLAWNFASPLGMKLVSKQNTSTLVFDNQVFTRNQSKLVVSLSNDDALIATPLPYLDTPYEWTGPKISTKYQKSWRTADRTRVTSAATDVEFLFFVPANPTDPDRMSHSRHCRHYSKENYSDRHAALYNAPFPHTLCHKFLFEPVRTIHMPMKGENNTIIALKSTHSIHEALSARI
jgi:hypothetical protein